MRILSDSDLPSKLSSTNFLFLDTNTLVTAVNYEEYGQILNKIKDAGCALLTIPSVAFEFTRGSDNIDIYNSRADFLNSIATVFNIEKDLENAKELIVALQKIASDASYTDFLLGICSGKYQCGVLTENHKHFPLSVFDRKFLITIDTDKENVRTHAVYFLSVSKLHKAAENIVKK